MCDDEYARWREQLLNAVAPSSAHTHDDLRRIHRTRGGSLIIGAHGGPKVHGVLITADGEMFFSDRA